MINDRKYAKRPQFLNQKLRLVVSNPSPHPSQKTTITDTSDSSCFCAEIHSRGPNLYEMSIKDSHYSLKCDLILEVEKAIDELASGTVICHFPIINGEQLKEFVEEDETLFGMIMIQFQMKILEQLFLFSANHYASELMIFVDDDQADELGIYRDFLVYEDQTITSQGEKTEMVIPTDRETYDKWVDFMQEVTVKFQKTLWNEQKSNPLIQQYLAMNSVVVA
jgi:hypothetical protein